MLQSGVEGREGIERPPMETDVIQSARTVAVQHHSTLQV